jgi:argininosuccinate lyase
MPNKRNPDIPELIRAKSSHLISAAQQAHLLMKGLPTSYNSDLHELKKVFLLASNELEKCLKILVPFIQGLQINTKQAKQLLSQGHILATDIANLLTLQGMSFRDAYRELSFLISEATQNGLSIETYLKTANLKNPFLKKVAEQVTFEHAVETRNLSGGTSSLQVKTSLNHLRERLPILLD